MLRNGASPSINQSGNSALACVLRHVRDWEFRYEMLNMLLQAGGNPNIVGRDGSVPLMVCLVPLINKDPLNHFTHTMKVLHFICMRRTVFDSNKIPVASLLTVVLLVDHSSNQPLLFFSKWFSTLREVLQFTVLLNKSHSLCVFNL